MAIQQEMQQEIENQQNSLFVFDCSEYGLKLSSRNDIKKELNRFYPVYIIPTKEDDIKYKILKQMNYIKIYQSDITYQFLIEYNKINQEEYFYVLCLSKTDIFSFIDYIQNSNFNNLKDLFNKGKNHLINEIEKISQQQQKNENLYQTQQQLDIKKQTNQIK